MSSITGLYRAITFLKTRWRVIGDAMANTATVAVLLLSVTLVVRNHVFAPSGQRSRSVATLQGKALPAIPGVVYAASEKTLLVMASVSCKYCRASMPFYRQLTARARARHFSVTFVHPLGEPDFNSLLARSGMENVARAEASFQQLHVASTPMLILVNEAGVVDRVWVGTLDTTAEKEIIRIMG